MHLLNRLLNLTNQLWNHNDITANLKLYKPINKLKESYPYNMISNTLQILLHKFSIHQGMMGNIGCIATGIT